MVKKGYKISMWIASCIVLNVLFKMFASAADLPLWLDSFGTAIAAYLIGPFSGAVVGASTNIIFGIQDPVSNYYMIVNIMLGVMIGMLARKGYFEKLFNIMTACSIITVVTAAVSTVINYIFYDGFSGNIWGDGIFVMLMGYGVPRIVSSFIGEFFLDFLDKLIILLVLFVFIRIFRSLRKAEFSGHRHLKKLFTFMFNLFAAIIISGHMTGAAKAAVETPDYSSYIRTVYDNFNGLHIGEATDVATTRDGIVWIGTYAGLYRYSGNTFRIMDKYDRVKNVNCLFVDKEGRMWIGTNDDGLSVVVENSVTTTFDEDNGLPSNSVRCVAQSADGNFYVGTSGELAVVTLSGRPRVLRNYREINYAIDITADRRGNIAAVSAIGELFLMNGSGIVQKIENEEGSFVSCKFVENGFLYVGTEDGEIHIYDVRDGNLSIRAEIKAEGMATINSITQLENGCIFICADNGIAWYDNEFKYHKVNTANFNNSIDRMTVDYQGNLWFSSSRLGVMKLSTSVFMEVYEEVGLQNQVVNTITEWNGHLYFGTDKGLDVVNKEFGFVLENGLSEFLDGIRIRNLMVDKNNRLWICSYGQGIICAESPENYKVYSAENGALGTKFRSALELSDGTVAVASDLGVSFISEVGVTRVIGMREGLKNPLVLSMLETKDGKLLIGTDGGGIAVVEGGKVTDNFSRTDGLSSGVVLRMITDKDNGNVFIITSNGICYYKLGIGIRRLDNFPYSNNYDLLDKGDGKLYVTGSGGIHIVYKNELLAGKDLTYKNLNYLNGLRGKFTANAWNYVDGEVWYIAGSGGVTRFDLNKYNDSKSCSYRMLLNEVAIDGVIHEVEDEAVISVPSDSQSIEFVPEIINYSATEPYISYYLEGKEGETKTVMLQSELGKIVYSGLAEGTYKFKLSILDEPQGKPVEELIYTIKKEDKIYNRTIFKIFFFGELLLIVSWFTWFFTRKKIEIRMELQEKEILFAKEQIKMGSETILAIARAVDAKDGSTSQHSERVSEYSCLMAERMGYSEEALEQLRNTAILHDIGKIGVPDVVLKKPGQLTDEEYVIMQSHVSIGAEILKDITLIPHIIEGVLYHHERYDGKGYNMGLSGKDIPETARIIGIADAFDAMTSNRIYRRKLKFDKVLSELRKGRGRQFDPEILDVFMGLIEEGIISERDLYREESA